MARAHGTGEECLAAPTGPVEQDASSGSPPVALLEVRPVEGQDHHAFNAAGKELRFAAFTPT
ncbi:MAG: hypothetical protein M3N32_09695 [Actinomycetota bacterium]|nr:hypothetical protein [Actinomycetota bacterium]